LQKLKLTGGEIETDVGYAGGVENVAARLGREL
jgi:hypothetical protein